MIFDLLIPPQGPRGGGNPPYSQVPHLGYDPFSQSFSHLTIEREPVGTAQVHSDLNKLSAEAAAEHSSSFSEDCEVSDIVCAHCLKKEDRQNYVAVQAVKASVIVAKSVRYQIGPHISSCANLSNL